MIYSRSYAITKVITNVVFGKHGRAIIQQKMEKVNFMCSSFTRKNRTQIEDMLDKYYGDSTLYK